MRIKKDFIGLSTANIVSSFIGFINVWVLARYMTIGDFAKYELTITLLLLFIELSDFGLNLSIVDLISKNTKKAQLIFNSALGIKFFVLLIISLSLIIFKTNIEDILKFNLSNELVNILILGVSINGFLNFIFAFLQSKNQIIRISIYVILLAIIKLILILYFLYFMGETLDYKVAFKIMCLSPILVFFLAVKGIRVKYSFNLKIIKEIMSVSLWIFMSSFVVTITQRINLFLINEYLSNIDVANYALAFRFNLIFILMINALTFTLLPRLENILKKSSIRQVNKILYNNLIYLVILVIILSIAIQFLTTPVFGDKFKSSILPAQLLFVSSILSIISALYGLYYINKGKLKVLFLGDIIKLFLVLLAGVILIPRFGIIGAVSSTIIMRLFGFVYLKMNLFRLYHE